MSSPLDETKKISLKFCKHYFQNNLGVMLTGSWSRELQNNYSDIDLVIIVNDINNIKSGKYNYLNKYSFDVILLQYQSLHKVILESLYNLDGSIPIMLSDGIILIDDHNILFHTQVFCKTNINAFYPNVYTYYNLQNQVSAINNLNNDLKSNKLNKFEEFITISKLIEISTDLNLYLNRGFIGRGKQKVININKVNPDYTNRIIESIHHYLKSGSLYLFISAIDDNLNYIGKEIIHYKLNKSNSIIDNNFYIRISLETISIHEIYNKIAKLFQLFRKIGISFKYIKSNDSFVYLFCNLLQNHKFNESKLKLEIYKLYNLPPLFEVVKIKINNIPIFFAPDNLINLMLEQINIVFELICNNLLHKTDKLDFNININFILYFLNILFKRLTLDYKNKYLFMMELSNIYSTNNNYSSLKREFKELMSKPIENKLKYNINSYFNSKHKLFDLKLRAIIDNTNFRMPEFQSKIYFGTSNNSNYKFIYFQFINVIFNMLLIDKYKKYIFNYLLDKKNNEVSV